MQTQPLDARVVTVPYSSLTASPLNVRRRPATQIEAMADSIRLSGLLQNLVVHVIQQGRSVKHGVCAGQRRHRALDLLHAQGEIPADYPVPVKIVSDAEARATSLIENAMFEPMHPADQFEAFRDLIAEGRTIEHVAALFSISAKTVQRRLKLAAASPKLFDLFRADAMTLDQLMALSLTDDHAEQERIWATAQAGYEWQRTPHNLREAITHAEIDASDHPLARFVGLAVYEAAGGYVRRDLFSDEEQGYIADAGRLTVLAAEKLDTIAREVAAEGWQWTETSLEYVAHGLFRYGRVHPTERKPTRAETKARKALQAALDAAITAYDEADEDAPNLDALQTEVGASQARLDAFDATLRVWTDEDKAAAGALVMVDPYGESRIERGLVKREDTPARSANGGTISAIDGDARSNTPKARPVHSERLCRQLSAHKTAAIQVELAARPEVAVAVLLARLIPAVFRDEYFGAFGHAEALDVSARCHHANLASEAEDMAESRAWQQIEADRQRWGARLPRRYGDLLPWLLDQDAETVSHLFAFCVAATLDGIQSEAKPHPIHGLADVLDVDMTRYWKASASSYFDHVSKARMAEVVTEVAGAEAAKTLDKLKKAEAAKAAERAVSEQGWLPDVLSSREVPAIRSWREDDDDTRDGPDEADDEAEADAA